jgi:hypothetical protein
MRIAGDEHVCITLTQQDKRALQLHDFGEEGGNLIPEPQAEVESYLVVSRAGGM